MSDNFIPLSEPEFNGNEWTYLKECIDTGWVSTAGAYVGRFENGVRALTGAGHAVACINGTAGLHIALKLCGVGPGDEVIVPTLTFIAPVNAARYLQAEPVFMDCDEYMNIDPEKFDEFCRVQCDITGEGLRNKNSGRLIKAVVPVHVFGNPCAMVSIMETARSFCLKVVEDATESLGSRYIEGPLKERFTGTIGDIGVYSFNGNKIITSGGGGMIVTDNPVFADRAAYLCSQAKNDPIRYVHDDVGYNYRLTNIQAAVGTAQLERLDAVIRQKLSNYLLYADELRDISGIELVGTPEGTSPNYWFYTILIDPKLYGMDREALMQRLSVAGIQTRPLWLPNHLQKPYRDCPAYRIERAVSFWERALNLPCSPSLSPDDVVKVVKEIRNNGV